MDESSAFGVSKQKHFLSDGFNFFDMFNEMSNILLACESSPSIRYDNAKL